MRPDKICNKTCSEYDSKLKVGGMRRGKEIASPNQRLFGPQSPGQSIRHTPPTAYVPHALAGQSRSYLSNVNKIATELYKTIPILFADDVVANI